MRRELVHQLRQHVGQLAQQVAVVHAQLIGHVAHRVAAQHTAQLVGRDGVVLARAHPGRGDFAQAALLHLVHEPGQSAQAAALRGLEIDADVLLKGTRVDLMRCEPSCARSDAPRLAQSA